MANLNSFNRRLDKIESSLPKQDRSQFEWDFSLFTPVEQAELQLFMASLPTSQNGFQLQGEQLFQFGCWLRLETALRDGNMAEAEKYRRRRAMTLEQLVDTFLNLDISSLPRDPNMPGPQVTEGRCTF